MVINKFWAAIAQVVVTVLAAFVLIPSDEFGVINALSLGVLFLQATVTFVLPLLNRGWKGGLKTVASALVGSLTALIPLWTSTDFTPQQIAIVVLAGLNALLSETGNYIRTETSKVTDAILAQPVLFTGDSELIPAEATVGGTVTGHSYLGSDTGTPPVA